MRKRICLSCLFKDSINHRAHTKTVIETKAEFSQIPRQMFWTHWMICPMNRSFHVANHGVNPVKQCIVRITINAFSIDWMMQIHDFTYSLKWPVTISRYNTIIMKMLCYPAIYFSGGKWSDFAHSHVHWMPFVVMGDCSKKKRFSCCSATTLSAFFLPPQ